MNMGRKLIGWEKNEGVESIMEIDPRGRGTRRERSFRGEGMACRKEASRRERGFFKAVRHQQVVQRNEGT